MKKSGFTRKAKVMMHKVQHALYQKLHIFCHKTEHVFHAAYMGLVSVEAHGFYRYAAMGTFAVIVLMFFMGGGAAVAAEALEDVEEL